MERTHLAHNVWYINYSDTFKRGVFLFVENNTYQEDGGWWQGGLLFKRLTR